MKELTFYNEPYLKESLLAYTKEHMEIDAYRRGKWLQKEKASNGHFKGCFYGCMTQSDENTLEIATEQYGLPLWYVYVTEEIYEGLPGNEWLSFPYEAIEVLPVGIDMNKIRSLWNYRLLERQLTFCKGNDDVTKAIKQCMNLFKVDFAKIAAWSARSAAWSAAESARSAAESAWSAAWSARSAAWSAARSAAESAVWSARSAAWSARAAAWSTAESAEYHIQKNILFSCIEDCTNTTKSVAEIIEKDLVNV